MDKKEEHKEAMERNKAIRAKENSDLENVLKNSTNDKEMRENKEMETELITHTSKDDARDKRKKIILIVSIVILSLAVVGAAVYFFGFRK